MSKRTKKEPYIELDPRRRKEALDSIRISVSQKETVDTPNIGKLLLGQIQYISASYWIVQGMFVIGIFLLFFKMRTEVSESVTYLAFLSAAAAFLGSVGIRELSRTTLYRMAEIENTCYFNLKQIWSIKMLLFGGIDVCLLSVLIAGAAREMRDSILAFGIYLVVPFMVSNSIYLFVLFITQNRENQFTQIVNSLLCMLLAMSPAMFPGVYEKAYLGIWAIVLLIVSIILGMEIYYLLAKMTQKEGILKY